MIGVDGPGITPGAETCICGPECEWPCWQRLGLSDEPCEECGCPPMGEGRDSGGDRAEGFLASSVVTEINAEGKVRAALDADREEPA